MSDGRVIMDAREMERTVSRMAHGAAELSEGTENLAVVGIRTGGAVLAERLRGRLEELGGRPVPLGVLDITLYRDDLALKKEQPILRSTEIPFSIQGKNLLLVDDVLFTGRTIRAALVALMDLGRARQVELAVLVDRGRRELPICPDIVGLGQPTSPEERVKVFFKEKGGRDEVLLFGGPAGESVDFRTG